MRHCAQMFQAVILVFALVLTGGCGDEIGDSCQLDTDCAPDRSRICDQKSPDGYCTVFGCDFDTCPDEAVCVRFFPNSNGGAACTQATEDQPGGTNDCLPSQLCALAGRCVERTAEVRFCMKKCGSGGDCRDNYECRKEDLMILHGGEPVPRPGEAVDPSRAFCAAAPSS